MNDRLMNDPERLGAFRELTEKWVRLLIDEAEDSLPRHLVVPVARDLAIGHIRNTIPAVEGFKDEYEVEYAVGQCQEVLETCIKEWEDRHGHEKRD